MIDDESVMQYPDDNSIKHSQKENGINPSIPYYWSWYRLAFPDNDQNADDPPILPQQEKQ